MHVCLSVYVCLCVHIYECVCTCLCLSVLSIRGRWAGSWEEASSWVFHLCETAILPKV